MKDPFVSIDGTIPELNNSTLIIPSVSIGNISQLTIDLFIHSFDFVKIGSLDDRYLYPFTSPLDYAPTSLKLGIANPIEVYHSSKLNISVVQQRSPIIPSFTKPYIEEILLPFISKFAFASVYVLDSFDAGMVENKTAGQVDVFTAEDFLNESLKKLKVYEEHDAEAFTYSSYSRELLKAVTEGGHNLHFNILVTYVYEGDNFHDAEVFGDSLVRILRLPTVTWVKPVSWLGVYGDKPVPNATEDGLFG